MADIECLTPEGLAQVWGKVKGEINKAVSVVYKPGGNKAASELTSSLLVAANLGYVYNLTTEATTTSDWTEGPGKTIAVGTDVGVVAVTENNSTVYKFNAYATKIDLSAYQTKNLSEAIGGQSTVEGSLAALNSGKADKDTDAVEGHLAKFDANGNPVDGGDTADYAKNLVAPVVQSDAEFVFRKTGGTLAVDGAGGAVLQMIKGKTLAWNQLCDLTRFNRSSGATYNDVTAGGAVISATDSGDKGFTATSLVPVGHKVLLSMRGKPSESGIMMALFAGSWISGSYASYVFTDTNWHNLTVVLKSIVSGNVGFYLANSTAGQSLQIEDCEVVDLTLLYGSEIDGMTDAEILAKFESEYPGYHDYNPGTLISNDASAIETVGFNQWDEEWEEGSINTSTGADTTSAYSQIRSKNYNVCIAGQVYYAYIASAKYVRMFFYDANMAFITSDVTTSASGGEITAPAGAAFFRIITGQNYGTTYNHDICINLSDPAKNGTYEPYWKKELHLGLNQIRVKSPNIWDEQWEIATSGNLWGDVNGKLAKGVVPAYGPNLENKELIPCLPNTSYYFRYPGQSSVFDSGYVGVLFADADMNILGGGTTSGSIVISPQSAAYMAFFITASYGASYNHDIMINLSDPGFNGKYYPYGVLTFEGLNGEGTVVDECDGRKFVRKYIEIDFGDFAWGVTYFNEHVFNVIPEDISIIDGYGKGISNKYESVTGSAINNNDKTYMLQQGIYYDTKMLLVHDESYDSATAFRNANIGTKLRYALANPEIFELVEPLDMSYEVDGDGTERRLPEDTASSVHAPFRADILYALNGSATLRNLDANYVRNDNIKQDTGNNEKSVMSQAAVTRELGILSQRIAMTDLSFIDPQTGVGLFTRNTANTYVVRAAGNYMFPLVYGNAIKNGKPNPAAYTRIISDYTAEFVNHLGNPITSPFIERNAGCNPFSATLLWQTGTGLIPSVSLVQGADCLYIRFSVASIPSDNGLACLAVKDVNGDVMWSWNIWLTTDDLSPETLTNYTDVEYEMMPEALGTIWSDRTNKLGYNPFFQWGRKDAVGLPAAYNDGTMHALYDINGNSVTISTYGVANDSDQGGTTRTVPYAIKHPELFFLYYNTTTYNWNNLSWMNNFWNAAETESSELADNQMTAIKTIYDPSPVGFIIPGPRAWTGFTSTGTNSSTASEFNVVGSFSDGWNFKKNSADAVGTKYLASGYRNGGDGVQYGVGSGGYYWSFAPYSQAGARGLDFSGGGVYPLDFNGRAYGLSVRPSREY